MTDAENIHVVSTTTGNVWLVEADNPDEAEQTVQTDLDPDADWVYYESTLDDHLSDVKRDGSVLLNP